MKQAHPDGLQVGLLVGRHVLLQRPAELTQLQQPQQAGGLVQVAISVRLRLTLTKGRDGAAGWAAGSLIALRCHDNSPVSFRCCMQ